MWVLNRFTSEASIGGFNQRLHLELHFVFRKTLFIGAVAAYAGTAQKLNSLEWFGFASDKFYWFYTRVELSNGLQISTNFKAFMSEILFGDWIHIYQLIDRQKSKTTEKRKSTQLQFQRMRSEVFYVKLTHFSSIEDYRSNSSRHL